MTTTAAAQRLQVIIHHHGCETKHHQRAVYVTNLAPPHKPFGIAATQGLQGAPETVREVKPDGR
jgi:hypothetical protein